MPKLICDFLLKLFICILLIINKHFLSKIIMIVVEMFTIFKMKSCVFFLLMIFTIF